MGWIVWHFSRQKPTYGARTEQDKDSDAAIGDGRRCGSPDGKHGKSNYIKQGYAGYLLKSAYKQGGLLSGAELSVLLNRSLTTVSRYLKNYHETHRDTAN
jgi:hypothetical protein